MLAISMHGYEVEFIPLERRLLDRRTPPQAQAATVRDDINAERRKDQGRRFEDHDRPPPLKVVR
ncbi:MAG: hypothetical protein ACLPXB_18630 [Thiobacillaceae bacterium]